LTTMKRSLFLSTLLVLSAAIFAQAEDALDSKLNEVKKKPHRRTYSTRAILERHDQIVPQTTTDKEKALDKKLREMNKKLDKEQGEKPSMMTHRTLAPRPVRRPAQEKPVNWLTPALLDDPSLESISSEAGDDPWIMAELTRQKSFQLEKLTREEEKKRVEQRLKDDFQRGTTAPFAPLNSYEASLQTIISKGSATPLAPQTLRGSYSSPYSNFKDRTPAGPTVLKPFNSSPSLFSISKQSQSTFPANRSSYTPQGGLNFNNTSLSKPFEQRLFPETLKPTRQRVRRTSPSYDENPFEENLMPHRKKSIWD